MDKEDEELLRSKQKELKAIKKVIREKKLKKFKESIGGIILLIVLFFLAIYGVKSCMKSDTSSTNLKTSQGHVQKKTWSILTEGKYAGKGFSPKQALHACKRLIAKFEKNTTVQDVIFYSNVHYNFFKYAPKEYRKGGFVGNFYDLEPNEVYMFVPFFADDLNGNRKLDMASCDFVGHDKSKTIFQAQSGRFWYYYWDEAKMKAQLKKQNEFYKEEDKKNRSPITTIDSFNSCERLIREKANYPKSVDISTFVNPPKYTRLGKLGMQVIVHFSAKNAFNTTQNYIAACTFKSYKDEGKILMSIDRG